MNLTREDLLQRLPDNRDFWFAKEIAVAMDVHVRSIQRVAKRFDLGRKVRHGPAGTYIFQYRDLAPLCEYVHGEVGNPINIAIRRARCGNG